MTREERTLRRLFWLEWTKRAQQAIGALLAETVNMATSEDDTVYECVSMLIDVEQQLSAVLEER